MPSNITVGSGTVKRIFVGTSDVHTYARFTLLGENTIHGVTTTDHDVRKELELTTPGDDISFEYELTGWVIKINTLRMFENSTLNNELSTTK